MGHIGRYKPGTLDKKIWFWHLGSTYATKSANKQFRIVPLSSEGRSNDLSVKKFPQPAAPPKKALKTKVTIVPFSQNQDAKLDRNSDNLTNGHKKLFSIEREVSSVPIEREEQPFPTFHKESSPSSGLDFPLFENIPKANPIEVNSSISSYETGDLIEIVVQKSHHVLGIVVSTDQNNNNLLYVLTLANKPCVDNNGTTGFLLQQVMTFNVRFRAKNWLLQQSKLTKEVIDDLIRLKRDKASDAPISGASSLSLTLLSKALKEFESGSFIELQKLLKLFPSFERAYLDQSLPLDVHPPATPPAAVSMLVRGLSPEEFLLECEKINSNQREDRQTPNSIERLHAAYRFLFCNSKYFVKPPFLGPNGPYFIRPPTEIAKINFALTVTQPQIEQFKETLKMYLERWNKSIIVDSNGRMSTSSTLGLETPSLNAESVFTSDTNRLLLWALQRYACSHKYNLMGINGHPLAPVVTKCLSGILDVGNEAGDLYPTLEKRGLLISDHNVHWEQSCLQYEIPTEIDKAGVKAISLDHGGQKSTMQHPLTFPAPHNPTISLRQTLPDGSYLGDRIEFGHSHIAIAIDSADTTEIDDALSMDDLDDSDAYWGMHVHVADPTAFIPIGSILERWCAQRTSSIYVPEAKAPMLPEVMLGAISLGGKGAFASEPLALTFSFKVDKKSGGILHNSVQIRPSILRNVQRLTYDEADALLLKSTEYMKTASLPLSSSSLLVRLSQVTEVLEKARSTVMKGASFLSFIKNRPSPEVVLEGPIETPTSIIKVTNNNDQSSTSRRIVSELMVAAGVAAAQVSQQLNLAVPYRRQDPPNAGPRLDGLRERIASFLASKSQPPPKIADIVGSYLVSTSGILTPSKVSLLAGAHWSMGLNAYLRVTSPMRRYADMLIHYQLKAALGYSGSSTILSNDALIDRLRDVNELEPQLKSLQRRAIRFWILTYVVRQPASKIWDAIILGGGQPSSDVSTFVCQIYILELYSSFSITIDSYMLSALGISSFQDLVAPGTPIQVTAGVVKRELNQVSWHLAALGHHQAQG